MEYFFNYFGFSKKDKHENYYYLSLLKDSDLESGWSIHGLWPQNADNSYPTFCRKVTFDIKLLESIIDDLNTYWCSYMKKNEDFWKHEWEKHGSCMYNQCDEYYYFKRALLLYRKALERKLPEKFYDEKTNKCLIPVNLNFEFIL